MINIALYITLAALVLVVPAYAWIKRKNKYLAILMVFFNIYWLWDSYLSYWSIMPENESGVVILGMAVLLPAIMVGVNLLLIPVAQLGIWTLNKIFKLKGLPPPHN